MSLTLVWMSFSGIPWNFLSWVFRHVRLISYMIPKPCTHKTVALAVLFNAKKVVMICACPWACNVGGLDYAIRIGIQCAWYFTVISTRATHRRHPEARMWWARCVVPDSRFMGPTWGPLGADRTQVGPMLAPWTLLSEVPLWIQRLSNVRPMSLWCCMQNRVILDHYIWKVWSNGNVA